MNEKIQVIGQGLVIFQILIVLLYVIILDAEVFFKSYLFFLILAFVKMLLFYIEFYSGYQGKISEFLFYINHTLSIGLFLVSFKY